MMLKLESKWNGGIGDLLSVSSTADESIDDLVVVMLSTANGGTDDLLTMLSTADESID